MNNTAPSKADQIYVVLLTGRAVWEICFNQLEALPRSGKLREIWNFIARFSDITLQGNQ